jgi:hypothetical protein
VLKAQIREFANAPEFIACDGELYRRKSFDVYAIFERPLPAHRIYRTPASTQFPIAA